MLLKATAHSSHLDATISSTLECAPHQSPSHNTPVMLQAIDVCRMHEYELLYLLLAEALIIQALSAQSLPAG